MSHLSFTNETMSPDDILKMYNKKNNTLDDTKDDDSSISDISKVYDDKTIINNPPTNEPSISPTSTPIENNNEKDEEKKISIDTVWMRKWYDIFNNLYWSGQLPSGSEIKFETCNTNRRWGSASYQYTRQGNYCTGPLSNFTIKISNYRVATEHTKKGTLLHEMIHIADYYLHPEHFIKNGRKVSRREYDAHGPVFFQKEAERLKQYGWNIQQYVTSEEQEQSELSDKAKVRLDSRKKTAVGGVLVYPYKKFIFKTDIDSIKYIKSHVQTVYYRHSELLRVEFYHISKMEAPQAEWFASLRNCKTSISGWTCHTDDEYKKRIDKYGFDEYPFDIQYVAE